MFTEIIMVLDRSSSMGSIKGSTICSVNEFLQGQRDIEGTCNFTLHQFDTEHVITHDAVNIQHVENLTDKTYKPQSATALHDAICMAIDQAGSRFAQMRESERPDNVMFVIMTDGYENSSQEFTMKDVNVKISHQKSKYQWDFVFLAANQDAMATGAKFGIDFGKTLTFAANNLGVHNSMDSVNTYMSNVRSGSVSSQASAFSDADREAQTNAGV